MTFVLTTEIETVVFMRYYMEHSVYQAYLASKDVKRRDFYQLPLVYTTCKKQRDTAAESQEFRSVM